MDYKKIIEDRIKQLEKYMARENESESSRQLLSFIISELKDLLKKGVA